jgi:hypothetical protein
MRTAIEAIRRHGVVDASLFAAARVAGRLTRGRAVLTKYNFMAQPVPAAGARIRSKDIVVSEVHAGDPRLVQFERTADELASRFAAGATCLAAWHGETLAGFLWFTERPYDEEEVRCTFRIDPRDRAVWDFDVHIVPRYRFGRTFALLWDSAFANLRVRGVRWSISRVTAFNPESMRAHQRLGARPTGWAVFFVWGSVHVTLSSLGGLKCRWLQQRPFPVVQIRAPAERRVARDDPSADTQCAVPRAAERPGDITR